MKCFQLSAAILALFLTTAVYAASVRAEALAPIGPNDDAAEVALKTEAKTIGAAAFTAQDYKPGLIRHVVLFKYLPTVTPAQKEEVKTRFLALRDSALRNGRHYIVSIETGAQNSGEGVDQGLEQGFIVTFRSAGDRNYYVGGPIIDTQNPDYFDPHHQAFKDFVGPLLDGVLVFDMAVT